MEPIGTARLDNWIGLLEQNGRIVTARLRSRLLLVLAWAHRWSWRRLVGAWAVVGSLALLIGGWLLVRNWQLYGDPTAANQFVLEAGGNRGFPGLKSCRNGWPSGAR